MRKEFSLCCAFSRRISRSSMESSLAPETSSTPEYCSRSYVSASGEFAREPRDAVSSPGDGYSFVMSPYRTSSGTAKSGSGRPVSDSIARTIPYPMPVAIRSDFPTTLNASLNNIPIIRTFASESIRPHSTYSEKRVPVTGKPLLPTKKDDRIYPIWIWVQR